MSSSRYDPDSSRLALKMTTSPSKRQRLSPDKLTWTNPLDRDPSLPRKPAVSLPSSSSSRPAESSRRGAHGMERVPSHGSSQAEYHHSRDHSRYSRSPEKEPYRGDRRDYGDSYYDEPSHRPYTSRPHQDWDRDWDRDWDHRGNGGRHGGDYEDDYYRRSDRREPRRDERGYYAGRDDRDDRRPRDSRHGRSPPRELGRSLPRPQRDDSGRHGRQDSYRPDDDYRRHSSPAHHSSSKRPKTPAGTPPSQHEEGELSEEEEGQVSSDVGEVRRSPARSPSPDAYAPKRDGAERNDTGQSEGRRLHMKDRPLARSHLPAPPPGRPATPPSPPPPPPDDTRPPSPPASHGEEVVNPYRPRDRPSHGTKLHEDPAHPPPAPNRNHLHPTTRASTPQLAAHTDSIPPGPVCPKKFTRPSLQEEQEAYGKAFEGTSTLAAYDIGKKLGEGTFGVVTKGTARVGGAQVALKKLLIHNTRDGVSVTTIREIKILKALKHKNVVPLVDMVVEPKASEKTNRQDIFMVFPYMDHDLCGLLGNRNFKMGHSRAKLFMKQLLEGMAYIHANGIVHRDIKTANILVNQKGEIMIADFGLARAWSDSLPRHLANEYTNMVVTRWYRAPELLLGDTHYGPAVDMWSVGCVLGEMYYRDPIMPGGPNDEDQMRLIAERLGPINDVTLPQWDDLRRYPGFPGLENHSWNLEKLTTPLFALAREWGMDSGGTDLLKQLLRLDPAKRLTAEDALEHSWFWSGVSVASVEKTDLGVESSHEMTTRKDHAPAPAYQQQLNDQNRQALQQHGSHRAYIPQQQQQPMQGGRPGWVGGPVKSHQQHARHAPYPPPQMRNGYDAMGQGSAGGYAPMSGLPHGMPPPLPSQVPPYPFGNDPQNGMMGGQQMGMNGAGQSGPGNGWNGPHGGGGYGMGNGPPWNGPPNGSNGSSAHPTYPSQYGGGPPQHVSGPPMRAPPSGPSAASGRGVPPPTFKLAGGRAGASAGAAGSYGGGPQRDSRDVPSHEWGHDDKRRRIYEHGAGDKRGPGASLDPREAKRPRNDALPY